MATRVRKLLEKDLQDGEIAEYVGEDPMASFLDAAAPVSAAPMAVEAPQPVEVKHGIIKRSMLNTGIAKVSYSPCIFMPGVPTSIPVYWDSKTIEALKINGLILVV
jgi:hypothetical protein